MPRKSSTAYCNGCASNRPPMTRPRSIAWRTGFSTTWAASARTWSASPASTDSATLSRRVRRGVGRPGDTGAQSYRHGAPHRQHRRHADHSRGSQANARTLAHSTAQHAGRTPRRDSCRTTAETFGGSLDLATVTGLILVLRTALRRRVPASAAIAVRYSLSLFWLACWWGRRTPCSTTGAAGGR